MPVGSTTLSGHFNIQHVYASQSLLYGGCCVFRPLAERQTLHVFQAHCCKESSLLRRLSIIHLLTTHLTLSCLSLLLILIVWPRSLLFTPLCTRSGPEPRFFFFFLHICWALPPVSSSSSNRVITPNQLMHNFRLSFFYSRCRHYKHVSVPCGKHAVSSGVSLLKVPPGVIVHKTLFYCFSCYTHKHGDDSVCWPALLPQWKWIHPGGSR